MKTMQITKLKPVGDFQKMYIDHQNLDGIKMELRNQMGNSCGECYQADAARLDNEFGKCYSFFYVPQDETYGIIYVIPFSNPNSNTQDL